MTEAPTIEAPPPAENAGDQTVATGMSPSLPWIEAGQAMLDSAHRIESMNEELGRWLRTQCPDPIDQDFDSVLAGLIPEWRGLAVGAWSQAKPFARFPVTVHRPSGSAWYELELASHATGAMVRMASVLPPLSELSENPWNAYLGGERQQRQMFIRLLRAEAQLGNLMQSWPGVIFSQRADFSFQSVSPRVRELTGISPEQWLARASSFWQVVHEADAEELHHQCRRAAKSATGVTTTFRLRNLETGRVAHVLEHRQAVASASGVVICYEGFWLDVTREKIAERRLSSAAWKQTLATLTMGLAHDFSNILAGILSLSEGFLSQIDESHPFASGVGLIRQNAWQACQLVQRMMSLHRCQVGEQNYHDLNELLAELADLLRRVLPRRIALESELASQQLPLYVDAVELRQVVLNLALNAAEAMPQRGKLVFQTRLCEKAVTPAQIVGKMPKLPCVCLSARDTGTGIAPRHLPFIFDPFFTTKPVNKGSGLGLYNTRLFAERHRGAISVESHEGTGTEFCLWLPLADFSEAERVQTAVVQQRPSVLLVGEAGLLHDSTAEFLRVHGFYVMQVFAPERAKDVLTAEDNHFRAVMILSGPAETQFLDLIPELRDRHPDLQVILQLVGGELEHLPAAIPPRLHLLIANDMSEQDMVRSLKRLFD